MPICALAKVWVRSHSPIKVVKEPHSTECLHKEQDSVEHRGGIVILLCCTRRFDSHQSKQLTRVGMCQRPGLIQLFDPDGKEVKCEVVLNEDFIGRATIMLLILSSGIPMSKNIAL